ncbi:hypothetical protein B0T26DRAFT_715327 [Lasiosphaeria miniovina]|uniref:Uncharacterized protein n=1 Tax=Lasiosphaeria miniovina TaxID=1954250 RepID=A0AA40ABG2_9PEZI|nr:uncharacterized protein B0T26DRAFT_715327 [Lasiosphaeria miniovina]KAK0712814.1 hypothetical protein B0T26DRAFT_715327 [Lasiosphaeria miniovina]
MFIPCTYVHTLHVCSYLARMFIPCTYVHTFHVCSFLDGYTSATFRNPSTQRRYSCRVTAKETLGASFDCILVHAQFPHS